MIFIGAQIVRVSMVYTPTSTTTTTDSKISYQSSTELQTTAANHDDIYIGVGVATSLVVVTILLVIIVASVKYMKRYGYNIYGLTTRYLWHQVNL